MATQGEYYVPVNKSIDCTGISLDNLASLYKINATPGPTPHPPPHMFSIR